MVGNDVIEVGEEDTQILSAPKKKAFGTRNKAVARNPNATTPQENNNFKKTCNNDHRRRR